MAQESLIGLAELSRRLTAIGTQMAGKTLRNATMSASLPAFRAIRQAAPVGDVAHRTYKGNLATPGFLKRSVRRRSYLKSGKAGVVIGVRSEAFYGVQFLDEGIEVTQRRTKGKGKKAIKPYRITGRRWFKDQFVAKRDEMERRLVARLRVGIAKATKA